MIAARVGTRAELSKTVVRKNETRGFAHPRSATFANISTRIFREGKQDPELRSYGYRPIITRRTRSTSNDADLDSIEGADSFDPDDLLSPSSSAATARHPRSCGRRERRSSGERTGS